MCLQMLEPRVTPTLPRAVARGRARDRKEALRALTLGAARRRGSAGKSEPTVPRRPGLSAVMEEVEAEEPQEFSHRQPLRTLVSPQRLKAAVHYTVGCLCQEVTLDKQVNFSKQTIAAISEVTFRQCENFAKDLEMFARHAKRSTVTTEDVKLLARRNNSLLKYITEKNEEIAQLNLKRKAKKKRKPEDESRSSRESMAEELDGAEELQSES
uniref:Centromere protein S n=1 Tax=Mus spicilegus TaxID=10103 RepID=A0A8C6H2L8_MUSSI